MKFFIAAIFVIVLIIGCADATVISCKPVPAPKPPPPPPPRPPPPTPCGCKVCGPGGIPCPDCKPRDNLCEDLIKQVEKLDTLIRKCVCGQPKWLLPQI